MSQAELLFVRYRLSDVLRNHEQKTIQVIEAFDSNRLINTGVEDLVDYFYDEYKVEPIILFTDQITVDQAESKIAVSRVQSRFILDRSQPFYIDGTRVTFFVPFEGDQKLLYCQPSAFNDNPPRAIITEAEIQFIYERLDHDAEAVKSAFDGDVGNLKKYLGWVERDANRFNSELKQKIRQSVELRRIKILHDQGLVASLGFPLRKREGALTTYAAPVVRKKIKTLPPASSAPYKPEPVLEMGEYEQILSIISNMVLVMERSPNAFHNMKEEDLRQHFLVQLNGQFEGQATGETFNFHGKTDILIRESGKNIFIAECKFWRGEKILTETIDQLLGYTSWHDTKTAILIFNRNKRFGEVINAIPEVVKRHPNFKRQLRYDSETNSRYVFHQVDDPNREFILTIMAFNMPGNE